MLAPPALLLIQATEAIKLIIGEGEPLIGRLLLFDALKMRFRELKLRRNPECPLCGDNPTIHALIDYDQFCGVAPQEQAPSADDWEITATQLKDRLDRGDRVTIIDVRNAADFQLGHLPGSLHVPLANVEAQIAYLPKTKLIVAYCT